MSTLQHQSSWLRAKRTRAWPEHSAQFATSKFSKGHHCPPTRQLVGAVRENAKDTVDLTVRRRAKTEQRVESQILILILVYRRLDLAKLLNFF